MAERPEKAIPVTSEERKNCFRRSDPKGKKDPTGAKEKVVSDGNNNNSNRKKDVTASGRMNDLQLQASVILILDRDDIPKKFPKNEFELSELVTSGQAIKNFNFRDESDSNIKMSPQV
jgi:hypothetical protein